MKKIYIVWQCAEFEGDEMRIIFSSKKKAEKYISLYKRKDAEIEEYDVVTSEDISSSMLDKYGVWKPCPHI